MGPALFVAFSGLAGCAGPGYKYERPFLSDAIEAHTGHDLGPGGHPGAPDIPPGVDVGDGVTPDEAVAIALWNNPGFQEAIAALGLQRADLVQAGLLTNPTFYVLFPVGPKQLEFTARFPVEALWLRPQRLAAAELDCQHAAALIVEHGLGLVRDVRTAHAALVLVRKRLDLAKESASLAGDIVELREARLRAGEASELDTVVAQVEHLRLREQAMRLTSEAVVAREQLLSLLGLGSSGRALRFTAVATEDYEVPPGTDELEQAALAARPDLRAAELALQAAGERAGLADWDFLRVTALLDANGEGAEGFEIGPGLDIAVPIFDQGQGARARASAELERAARRYVSVRESILLGVREAHSRYTETREAVRMWRSEIVPAVQRAVLATEKARDAGDVSDLALLTRRMQLVDSQVEVELLEKDLIAARAVLEREVGRRLDGEWLRALSSEASATAGGAVGATDSLFRGEHQPE